MAIIKSDATADTMTVDPTSKAQRETYYGVSSTSPSVAEADVQPTTVTATVISGKNEDVATLFRTDRLGSEATSLFTMLINDSFEGAVIHTLRWTAAAATMAAAQSTQNGLIINSTNVVAATNGYLLYSSRKFIKSQRAPLQARIRARLWHFNNAVMEFGFGDSTTAAVSQTTGAYWQKTPTGALQPVVTYNGIDITGDNVEYLTNSFSYYSFGILLDDNSATFVIQNTNTGSIINKQTINLPVSAQKIFSTTQIGVYLRNYIVTATQAAPILYVSDLVALMLDINSYKPWSDTYSTNSRSSYEHPFSGVQTCTWANSAAPASTTLANAGPGATSLGGLFQFAAVAGALTDFVLFGYAPIVPSTLVITGISIDVWNTGAASSATVPTVMNWALGFGSTAVSLATATTTRIPIGMNVLPINAAIGAKAESIYHQFRTPITIGQGLTAGRFVQVILRVTVGAATASQIIAGMVGFEGYFE